MTPARRPGDDLARRRCSGRGARSSSCRSSSTWLAPGTSTPAAADFFYLADAFLHGRTWLDLAPGPYDVDPCAGRPRFYVPFGPFPAIRRSCRSSRSSARSRPTIWQPIINAALAAVDVGLCWWLVGRLGVRRLGDRVWLVVLFGFCTQIWWVTTRGGVWHTGHLIATVLTLAA